MSSQLVMKRLTAKCQAHRSELHENQEPELRPMLIFRSIENILLSLRKGRPCISRHMTWASCTRCHMRMHLVSLRNRFNSGFGECSTTENLVPDEITCSCQDRFCVVRISRIHFPTVGWMWDKNRPPKRLNTVADRKWLDEKSKHQRDYWNL